MSGSHSPGALLCRKLGGQQGRGICNGQWSFPDSTELGGLRGTKVGEGTGKQGVGHQPQQEPAAPDVRGLGHVVVTASGPREGDKHAGLSCRLLDPGCVGCNADRASARTFYPRNADGAATRTSWSFL